MGAPQPRGTATPSRQAAPSEGASQRHSKVTVRLLISPGREHLPVTFQVKAPGTAASPSQGNRRADQHSSHLTRHFAACSYLSKLTGEKHQAPHTVPTGVAIPLIITTKYCQLLIQMMPNTEIKQAKETRPAAAVSLQYNLPIMPLQANYKYSMNSCKLVKASRMTISSLLTGYPQANS